MITILIPTYNRPDLLRRAVISALRNLVENAEVLVIDDGSDEPAQITLADIIATHRGVRVLNNGGPKGAAGARNFGVEHSRGQYILFLDDDDELKPNYAAQILLLASSNTLIYGFSSIERIDKFGKCTVIRKPYASGQIPNGAPLRHKISGLGCGFWISRQLYLKLGGLNDQQKVDEDTDLCCRLVREGYLPWYFDEAGVRVHVDHTCSEEVGAQLTKLFSGNVTSESYLRTWKIHETFFPAYSEARWFLGARYIRKATKLGQLREIWRFVGRVRPAPMQFLLASYAIIKITSFFLRRLRGQ